ncbi:MAG: AAA family ATPase [Bacteroidetes bacterium]|nr:AAA family ATPase [Bacteroidota bacterium]
MSKTVEKIVLKNFKAFRQEQPIDFKNKNVLIYGNNGAGKSSIFWALYTFLQSSIKSREGVEKYFKVFEVNNPSTHQSLRNVFEGEDATAYIELFVRDGEDLIPYRIPAIEAEPVAVAAAEMIPAEIEEVAPENIAAAVVEELKSEDVSDAVLEEVRAENISDAIVVEVPVDLSPITPVVPEAVEEEATDTNIKLLNTTSDFINYKLLSGFYRDSHKYDVNLWSVFERDIFPFITDNVNDKTFLEKLKIDTKDVERYDSGYKLREGWRKDEYIAWLDSEVNGKIDVLLGSIEQYANNFIKEHFYHNQDVLKVKLTFEKRFTFELIEQHVWEDGNKHIRENDLQIKLVVSQYDIANAKWIPLHRVQSFLNEAQLTRIAIGIRIGALRIRLQTTEFKLLVLDDMLISLDLSNRMEVIKIILNHNNKQSLRFFDSFQK